MHLRPGARAGDPAAFPGRGRDAPVEARRELERQGRAPAEDAGQETAVHLGRRVREAARLDRDPAGAEDRDAAPVDPRVRIAKRNHHARHPGGHQGFGAGRRPAVMGAGLQRHIGRRAPRRGPGHGEGRGLGMGAASRRGPPAADHPAPGHDDAAHGRVRPDLPEPAARQPERRAHEVGILAGGHQSSGGTGAGRSSETKSSKSSAAWKFL